MSEFLVFAFDPARAPAPAIAIAAGRAGAIGVLNAELGVNDDELQNLAAQVVQFGRGPFGLTVDSVDADRVARLAELAKHGLAWLFLPDRALASCPPGLLNRLRAAGMRIIAEVTSCESTPEQAADHIDGVLVKGHESGGCVGEETSLMLLQHWLHTQNAPVYVRGGVGLHSCAGLVVAGAAGVVLDNQLLLLKESPLRDSLRPLLSGMVGTETALIGDPGEGRYIRVLDRPNFSAVRALREEAASDDLELPAARLRALGAGMIRGRNCFPSARMPPSPSRGSAGFAPSAVRSRDCASTPPSTYAWR